MDGSPKYVPPSGRQLPTARQLRRMKFGWRLLLICNFGLGAYLFAVPKKKSNLEHKSSAVEEATSIPVEATTQFYETPLFSPPQPDSVIMQQQPNLKDQEHDLFGWLKRKQS